MFNIHQWDGMETLMGDIDKIPHTLRLKQKSKEGGLKRALWDELLLRRMLLLLFSYQMCEKLFLLQPLTCTIHLICLTKSGFTYVQFELSSCKMKIDEKSLS